jgi:uncharacterized membrane protein
MQQFRNVMELIGTGIDAVGVLVVVAGALYATGRFLVRREELPATPYRIYRQNIGRAILLGLEFLVAGDIIRTVVVSPTIANVLALGLIVLIRTFLSMSLEVELEGKWPWQRSTELSSQPTTRPEASV